MSTKHSPAPFTLCREGDYCGIDDARGRTVIMYGIESDDGGIRGSSDEEREANVHLFKAAPALLAACKAGAKGLQYVIDWYADLYGDDAIEELPTERAALAELAAAIALAEPNP